MSTAEILSVMLRGVATSRGSGVTICTDSGCATLRNPEYELKWSSGMLTEIVVSGRDSSGRPRRFRRSLAWSPDGYLEKVGAWEEAT